VRRDYYQHAYVTTDWRRAMDEIGALHGIGHYMEMPDAVRHRAGPAGSDPFRAGDEG
jgi:hypothetical protein